MFPNAKEREQDSPTLMLIPCLWLLSICLCSSPTVNRALLFYRQPNPEQMLIERNVVLSVTLKISFSLVYMLHPQWV